jgi:hypothetical protein
MNKINVLINIYNEKINGWSNHLGNLVQLNIKFNKIQISDLNDDLCFILPISCGGLNPYLDILDEGGSGGNTFLYFLDDRVRNLIRDNNGYILINYLHEGHIRQENYKELHNELLNYNIPANKVIFVSSNVNGKKQYETFCDNMPLLTKSKIHIIEANHMLESSVDIYNYVLDNNYNKDLDKVLPYKQSFVNKTEVFRLLKYTIREKYFLCYNRVIREYRLALVAMIYKMGLQDKGIISLGAKEVDTAFGGVWPDYISDFIEDKKQNEIVSDALKKIKPLYPIDADSDIDANWIYKDGEKWGGAVGQWSNFSHQYKRIYFNIVTESCYNEDCIYMSEKIFKPISNLVPFIIVSTPFFLKKLREIGYKTFHPWINESYDEEVDNDKRFFMILDEIKRLCTMSKEEIHKWYYEMEDILLYNQEHFASYKKQDGNNIGGTIMRILYED